MTSEKTGRNKTINTSVKEGAIYLERCISVKEKQDSLDLVMDKTILGDSMQVCALLPENSVDLIIADPANYLKYYIGYLEFLELKKDAVDKWEDNFTQMQFHKAVLDVGPASFDVIRAYLF